MYISRCQVSNYKSYRDSSEVEFKPGFNIITGQNSAGKTALIDALTQRFAGSPHRSLQTIPAAGLRPDEWSVVRLTLVLSGNELLRSLQSMGDGPYLFPVATLPETQATMDQRLEEMSRLPELELSFRFAATGSRDERWVAEDPFLGLYKPALIPPNHQVEQCYPVVATKAGLAVNGELRSQPLGQDVRIQLAPWLRTRIYRFKAERFNVGQYAFGESSTLLPDAANLPQVLGVLNANPARMARLNEAVSRILPQVRRVSVRPLGSNQVEIQVWPHDYMTERWDLAIPLNESGSGVGQVVAILYLVLTSDHPQVIIIDEPQNFLHPGALRKLIEELKQHPQHQYIFATHSPTVIAASDPATFTMVRATDGVSTLEIMDPRNAKHLQAYLSEIGARLADVFGADNILWVEGQTEEDCFPLIVRKIAHRSLMGTAIVGIRQTGDLQGRDKKKVLEMYLRLSEARTLLPPAIAFVFDEECLTEDQKDDLTRMNRSRVRFLPRRMYENYLLDPTAVAAVMNAIEGFRDEPVSENEVQRFFQRKCGERKEGGQQLRYFCKGIVDVPTEWKRKIDAAKLLENAFEELSATHASYEKTTHSLAITEWLIEHKPGDLREIADFLVPLLGAPTA